MLAVIQIAADPDRSASEVARAVAACYKTLTTLQRAEEQSGYQVERLLEGVS